MHAGPAARGSLADAALSLVARVVARCGPVGRARLGRALGLVAGDVLRIRRALVEEAMARAGLASVPSVASRMYRALGVGLAELLWLHAARPEDRDRAVAGVAFEPEAALALDEALARGPVVLLASHTGNWELAAAAAARLLERRGRRLFVVAKRMHARGVDAFLATLRARLGVGTIAPRGALSATAAALVRGDVVAMPIDQVPERAHHGLPVRFLAESALADRAPATLAWRARASVLVVAADRAGPGGAHRVRLLAALPPRGGAAAARPWIDATTERATAALEAFVLRAPADWLWLHRRWRTPREGGASARGPLVATGEAS